MVTSPVLLLSWLCKLPNNGKDALAIKLPWRCGVHVRFLSSLFYRG